MVREQLHRLAGLDLHVVVEEVPPTLRWRTRMRYVALPEGRRGLHVHRSRRGGRGRRLPDRRAGAVSAVGERRDPRAVATSYGSHDFAVDPDGFWQSHVEAPRVLVETVLAMLRPEPGERVLDLYAGVGLFSAFLADAVGPTGRVVAVEGSRAACQDARTNLPPASAVEHGPVGPGPGVGVRRAVRPRRPRPAARGCPASGRASRSSTARPRAVAYVACDPAALARDLATFAELGYPLATSAPSTSSR